MGLIIEVDGEAVLVGELGGCESEMAQHPQNQGIDSLVLGEAVIRSMFLKGGSEDEL